MIKITIELNEKHYSPDTTNIERKITVENYQNMSAGEDYILENTTRQMEAAIKEYQEQY